MTNPLVTKATYNKRPIRVLDGDRIDPDKMTRELGAIESALKFSTSLTGTVFNALDYGVDPRGAKDSTSAMRDLLLAANGAPILIPPGAVILVDSIETSVPVTFIGSGTLKHTADATGPMLALVNDGATTIRSNGVTFDGNRANQTTRRSLLSLEAVREATFLDCTFTGSVTAALDLSGELGYVTVAGSTFEDMAEHGGTTGETSHAIYLVGVSATHVSVRFNRFLANAPSDVDRAPAGVFVSVSGSAPLDLLYNYFHRIGQREASNFAGCVDAYTNGGRMTVTGNRAVMSYYVPYKLQVGDEFLVTGNRIEEVIDSTASLGIVVLQNVRDPGVVLKYAVVADNFVDAGAGVDMDAFYCAGVDAYHSDGLILRNNVVTRAGRFALLERVAFAELEGNIADNLTGGSGTDSAVMIEDTDQGAGAPDRAIVRITGGRLGTSAGGCVFARTNVTNLDVTVDGVTCASWQTGNVAVTVRDALAVTATNNRYLLAEPQLDIVDVETAVVHGNEGTGGTVAISGVDFLDYGLNPAWDAPGGLVTATTTYPVPVTAKTILGDATSAAFDVDLPSAVLWAGRVLTIKKVDASANAVTVDADGTELIDGAGTFPLAAQYDSVTIQSDGADWWVLETV